MSPNSAASRPAAAPPAAPPAGMPGTAKPAGPRPALLLAAAAVGILALACLSAVVVLAALVLRKPDATAAGQPFRPKDYTRDLQDCAAAAGGAIQLGPRDAYLFERIWQTCANQVYEVDLLEDFDIRRDKLLRQNLDERVVMWMVVGITVSGVLLAGLQLLGSFALAVTGLGRFGDPSTLTAEAGVDKGRISVQSSITGLMILVVSLAFFIVYVKWVYMITEVPVEKPAFLPHVAPAGASAAAGAAATFVPTVGTITGRGTLGTPPPTAAAGPQPPARPAQGDAATAPGPGSAIR